MTPALDASVPASISLSTPLIGAMSEQQVRAFLDHAKVNPGLRDQLKAEGSDPVAIAAAVGFVFSSADLSRYQARRVLEISDEDLQCVSGGVVVLAGADWSWLRSEDGN